MGGKPRKTTTSPDNEPEAAETPQLHERWSAQRKTELLPRLLRREALYAVSRESQVPADELQVLKRMFLEQGTRGLRIRGAPEERELTLTQRLDQLVRQAGWRKARA